MDARFGELRSVAHGPPSQQSWARLGALVLSSAREDEARWREQLAPYLDRALERWPSHLRLASHDDARALLDGLKPGPLLDIARALPSPSGGGNTTPAQWARLAANPALERIAYLKIEGVGVNLDHWAALLASPHLGRLGGLELRCCSFGASGARLLANSALCGRLTTLMLEGCQIGRKGAQGLLGAELGQLERLELMRCKIGVLGARKLAQSARGPRPHALKLDGMELVAQGALDALSASEALLSRVTSLELPGFTNFGRADAIPRLLDRCGRLERLDLCWLSLHGHTLRATLEHANLRGLRSLRTRLYPGAAFSHLDQLTQAPFIPVLCSLDLSGTYLGDEGAAKLAQRRELASLDRLRLDYCHIGPPGLRALLSSSHTAAALRAGHPDGRVRSYDGRHSLVTLRFDEHAP